MNYKHKSLAAGRWKELSLVEQLANVGSEVGRAINWRKKGKIEYSKRAFERALELLDLTVATLKDVNRLRELLRARELMVDFFVYDNRYHSTTESWQKYFLAFNYAARA